MKWTRLRKLISQYLAVFMAVWLLVTSTPSLAFTFRLTLVNLDGEHITDAQVTLSDIKDEHVVQGAYNAQDSAYIVSCDFPESILRIRHELYEPIKIVWRDTFPERFRLTAFKLTQTIRWYDSKKIDRLVQRNYVENNHSYVHIRFHRDTDEYKRDELLTHWGLVSSDRGDWINFSVEGQIYTKFSFDPFLEIDDPLIASISSSEFVAEIRQVVWMRPYRLYNEQGILSPDSLTCRGWWYDSEDTFYMTPCPYLENEILLFFEVGSDGAGIDMVKFAMHAAGLGEIAALKEQYEPYRFDYDRPTPGLNWVPCYLVRFEDTSVFQLMELISALEERISATYDPQGSSLID